ncbi:hypothetical protein NM688_g5765 [Phlebia brevispora]|uniref:Uncharacterized protein n=1 Tax=Phlebia brevispora TaxID=194682 RepID=A0ACC1SQ87_9APHY|nr:hypothetical protein NM688_g5765 [Phlebia brevispora]
MLSDSLHSTRFEFRAVCTLFPEMSERSSMRARSKGCAVSDRHHRIAERVKREDGWRSDKSGIGFDQYCSLSSNYPPLLLSEDRTDNLPMAWRLPEASKSCSPTELALQWTRVPHHQLPNGFIVHAHFHQPATAADLPAELCYMVLKFLSLGTCYKTRVPHYKLPGELFQLPRLHDCKDEAECTRKYVGCDWQELCQIALVCRQWYHLLKDELNMAIYLYNREHFKVILANLDSIHRYTNARRISGRPDIIEHLHTPWIHQISLRILPALKIPTKSVELEMKNSGPFPRGQIVSSIHNSLPKRLPHFSSGIRTLNLRHVHFKRFEHLVRLIKEMPSVMIVSLQHVTWDPQSLDRDQGLPPTSFLQREDPARGVEYDSEDCTSDRAALWLAICIGLTREDVLDSNDARSLWAIMSTSKLSHHILDGQKREVDEIYLYLFHVFLTPRAGFRHERRVRAVAVHLWNGDWSLFDWGEIDRRLASLGALEVVLLVFHSYDSLCEHRNSIRTSFLCLKRRPHIQLKLAFYQDNWKWRQAFLTDDGVEAIGEPVEKYEGWKEFLREIWTSQLATTNLDTSIPSLRFTVPPPLCPSSLRSSQIRTILYEVLLLCDAPQLPS